MILRQAALLVGVLLSARAQAHAPDYALRGVGRDFRGENQAQALSVALHEGAASVTSTDAQPVRARLELTGFGREGQLEPVALRGVSKRGSRIEHDRGPVREWFENGPQGLQQGFDIACRHAGSGPLVLEISFHGVTPALRTESRVALLHRGRERLSYDTLRAWDADGKELSARMRVVAGRVQLWVDDEGARYPLVVDPFVQHQKLTPDEPYVDGGYGEALASEGDTLLIGAPGDGTLAVNGGAVHVLTWDGHTWTERAKVFPDDPLAGAKFGSAVALSGNTMVVGAPMASHRRSQAGATYVFVRDGSTWRQQTKLEATSPQVRGYYGCAVTIDGDHLAAGECGRAGPAPEYGRAYVYSRAGDTWTERAALSPSMRSGFFGRALAMLGDTLMVGAHNDWLNPTALNAGAVYLYTRREDGTWAQGTKLVSVQAHRGQKFGATVSLDGDRALIGASADSGEGLGAVYVFERLESGWVQRARLTPQDPDASANFGSSLELKGNRAVIGASTTGGSSAAAYVFARVDSTTWLEHVKIRSTEPQEGDRYAASVALSGEQILVGAPGRDEAGVLQSGAVHALIDRSVDLGEPCRNGVECPTGFCVDGVCCAEACSGGALDCRACSNALTGQPNGTCAPVLEGSACGSATDAMCDAPNTCDATGQCLANLAPVGTPCEAGLFCFVGDRCLSEGVCHEGSRPRCAITEKCDEERRLCVPSCGDGVLDTGEECDRGVLNSDEEPGACRTNCQEAHCGDGVKDPLDECDMGLANSDSTPDSCRQDCRLSRCGDGVRDTGEGCDEGAENGTSEAPTCRADCSPLRCGDGVRDPEEDCDDGVLNSRTKPNACRLTCVKAHCGDGVVDDEEACDLGPGNADDVPDRCRTTCRAPACGDGVVDLGEACEPARDGERCTAACAWIEQEPAPVVDASMPMEPEADAGVPPAVENDAGEVMADDAGDGTKISAGGCTVGTDSARPPWLLVLQLGGLLLFRTARRARRRTDGVSAA